MDITSRLLMLGASAGGGQDYWRLLFNDVNGNGGTLYRSLRFVSDAGGNIYGANGQNGRINLLKISAAGSVLFNKQKGLGSISDLALSSNNLEFFTTQQQQGSSPHFSKYSTTNLSNTAAAQDDSYALSTNYSRSSLRVSSSGALEGIGVGSNQIYYFSLGPNNLLVNWVRILRVSGGSTYTHDACMLNVLSTGTYIIGTFWNYGGAYKNLHLNAVSGSTLLWKKQVDDIAFSDCRPAITVGSDNSIYIAVRRPSSVFIYKVNSSGNLVWQRRLVVPTSGQFAITNPRVLSIAYVGNRIIIGGDWNRSTVSQTERGWVMGVDESGNLLWHNEFGSGGYNGPWSISAAGADAFLCAIARSGFYEKVYSLYRLPANGSLSSVSSPADYFPVTDTSLVVDATAGFGDNGANNYEIVTSAITTAAFTEVAQTDIVTPTTLTPL
jgi:hypothetical protein